MNDFLTSEQRHEKYTDSHKKNTSTVIMVVENDPDTLLLISELLKGLGYEVIEAGNGREALEKITRSNPAIVFMDIDMPVLNGYDATLALRKMEKPFCNIPVIAVTAHSTNEELKMYSDAGINQVIAKPFRLAEIELKLKQQLQLQAF
ncbi:MAG: response regulator [Agriterribacter sp.]